MMIQIMPDGHINVMDSEFEPLTDVTAEIIDSAEGQLWVEFTGLDK